MSTFALTRAPSVAALPCVSGSSRPIEHTAIHTNPRAATSIPRPIFSGDVGSLPILLSQEKRATLTGVSALAGYTSASNGHLLAFSIMNNGVLETPEAQSWQDEVCLVLHTTK